MTALSTPVTIAIVNSNEELLKVLKDFFEQEGYTVATAHVRTFREHLETIEPFLAKYDPQVLIWDIAPPYDEAWRFLQTIRQLPLLQGRQFILTTTNERQVRAVAGSDEKIVEIVCKPYDLEHLLQLVERARMEGGSHA